MFVLRVDRVVGDVPFEIPLVFLKSLFVQLKSLDSFLLDLGVLLKTFFGVVFFEVFLLTAKQEAFESFEKARGNHIDWILMVKSFVKHGHY